MILFYLALKGDAKFEEKLTCGEKWHEEYGTFSPEHLKISKLLLWLDPLI